MFKNAGKLNESDKTMSDFKPFKKGNYVFEVREAEMGETDVRDWNNGGQPTGEKMAQLTIKFNVYKENGSTEIENIDGVVLVNPSFTFWVNDTNLGWFKKKKMAKAGRAVIAALINVPSDADITAGFDVQALVGKTMKAYLTVETSKAGKERNVIMDPEYYSKEGDDVSGKKK